MDPSFIKENSVEKPASVKSDSVLDQLFLKENAVEAVSVKSDVLQNKTNNSMNEINIKEESFPDDLVSKCRSLFSRCV